MGSNIHQKCIKHEAFFNLDFNDLGGKVGRCDTTTEGGGFLDPPSTKIKEKHQNTKAIAASDLTQRDLEHSYTPARKRGGGLIMFHNARI